MTGASDFGPGVRALVLRRVPYGESDLVVHFATPDLGRIGCFARGARRSRKRFPSGFPTFAILEIRFGAARRGEGLRPLHEGVVVRPNLGVSADLVRFAAGSLLLEIGRDMLPEDHPEPAAFEAIEGYLRALDEAAFDPADLVAAEMRLLAPLGLVPQLGRCVVCDRPAPPGRAAFFDARRGGVVCRRCGGGPLTLPGAARDALLGALGPASDREPRAATGRDALRAAHRAVLAFLEYHRGRRYRSAALLEDALRESGVC